MSHTAPIRAVIFASLAALQAIVGTHLAPRAGAAEAPDVRAEYRASVGTVAQSGFYAAPPTGGTGTVTARHGTLTNVVPVVVVGGGSGTARSVRATRGGLWLEEDFSRYSSAEHYRSNPFGWLATAPRWFNQSRIALDSAEGYDGSPQSLRYDWWGNGASGCGKDITIATSYKAPPASEVWIEVVHKFATTFNTNVVGRGGACKFGEYKFLLFWRPTGDRFDLVNGKLGREWWSANPETPSVGAPPACSGFGYNCRVAALGHDPLWDGQWHVYRAHIRFNSASGVPDGVFELWVDGKLVKSRQGIDMTGSRSGKWSNRLSEIFLGSNSNSGTGQPTHTWWGRLRVYTSDPGW